MGNKPRVGAAGRYIALLRGINVGGHHIVPMAELRELCERLGCGDVTTYIQSGNVVFTANASLVSGLAEVIADGIEERFGFRVPVMLRTAAEMANVVARNPFAGRGEPMTLHVGFLDPAPTEEAIAVIDRRRIEPDEFDVVGRELFLYLPDGMGKSKLTNAFFNAFRTRWTVRNWRTVNKLADLATGL